MHIKCIGLMNPLYYSIYLTRQGWQSGIIVGKENDEQRPRYVWLCKKSTGLRGE